MGFAYVATLDCGDPERQAPFWAEALRYRSNPFVSDIETEVSRMKRLGARRLSPAPLTGPTGDRWIVMTDPDGNEFCVCVGDITQHG